MLITCFASHSFVQSKLFVKTLVNCDSLNRSWLFFCGDSNLLSAYRVVVFITK